MIDFSPPPKPKLWTFPRPAIIRAAELPRTPADGHGLKLLLGSVPGFMPAPAPVPPLESFTFVDSGNTATSTGTIPAAAAVGDLCVCFNAATQNNTLPTEVVPTDFEILANHVRDGANFRVRGLISAKILESGEPGSNVTLMSAGNSNRGILAVFRPNAPINSFTANGVQGEGTGGDPAQQTINVTGSPSFPAISLAHWGATSAVGSRVATNLTDISGSSTAHWAAYRLDNAGGSPANGVVDMADSGSNVMQSLYLTFA